MKFIIPAKSTDTRTVNEYINKCSLWLVSFKSCLRQHIDISKLNCRKTQLLSQPNINWITNSLDYNIVNIIYLYINNLQCVYNSHEGYCYYTVSNNIRCPNTKTPLNDVIRTLEYGGANMPPLYWIRPSFSTFIESTVKIKNKYN